jgi:hypothetical protein
MNSRIRVSVLCFWLFFLAFRPILCCCVHIFVATVTPPSFAREENHLLLRPPVLLHLLFGCGDIFEGSLAVTSLGDTVSSGRCSSASPLFGLGSHHCLRAPLGSGLDPSRPTDNLGSSLGQAFQNHLFGRHHCLHNTLGPRAKPPPPMAKLVSLPTHPLQPRLYPHLLRSTTTTDES